MYIRYRIIYQIFYMLYKISYIIYKISINIFQLESTLKVCGYTGILLSFICETNFIEGYK